MTYDPADPSFWLVWSLPWPEDSKRNTEECLIAVAPETIPDVYGTDVRRVLELAKQCALANPQRKVILFADVTKWLGDTGSSWDEMGINWSAALDTLADANILSSFLTATQQGWMLASTNSSVVVWMGPRGPVEDRSAGMQRSILRVNLANEIKKDWPRYVEQMRAEGRIAIW